MNRRRRSTLLGLLAALTTLTACSGGQGGAQGSGELTVVTSSYPLEFVARQIAGDRADVRNLTPPGADSHNLELTPQQIGALGEADVVVHLSGMQPAVDEALQTAGADLVVDAVGVADLDGDPHFWLDPARLANFGHQVADGLAEADPDRAAEYTAAADELAQTLTTLDTEYRDALSGCRGATLVTSHEAFGYLADEYGLEQIGIAGIDPHVEPSPARMRDVVDAVEGRTGHGGVRTVFFEATTSPAVAQTLADDLGVTTGVLHPVERVEADQDYLGLMRENLRSLQDGLVCG